MFGTDEDEPSRERPLAAHEPPPERKDEMPDEEDWDEENWEDWLFL